MPPDKLWLALTPLLLLDLPRYVLGSIAMALVDFLQCGCRELRNCFVGKPDPRRDYCPTVCVVIVGLNEAATITSTLASVWRTYPDLRIIVVDDGSSDGMADRARRFAARHEGVSVLRKERRGGKSSALNFALACSQAEIIVGVDADCCLAPGAIWQIIQPFRDPRVGAVSGSIMVRDPFRKLVTWLQALEYLRCIAIGRRLTASLGVIGIVPGALGAYRHDALQRAMGWDVGPGEDGDLTLRLRKSGFGIAFAPNSVCYTNPPNTWLTLARQRRRWEWATVTFCCRKHRDMCNPLQANFRLGNSVWMFDRWIFNLAMTFLVCGYAVWLCMHATAHTINLLVLYYLVYCCLDAVQLMVILYFSQSRLRDLWVGMVFPLAPLYHGFLRAVSLFAITEELLTRRSYRDNFVPAHVRSATWHW